MNEADIDFINGVLQEVAEQSRFDNTMIVYEHMLAEEEANHQAEWWKTVGPGYDDEQYNYDEWN